jgi:hypothetical protein
LFNSHWHKLFPTPHTSIKCISCAHGLLVPKWLGRILLYSASGVQTITTLPHLPSLVRDELLIFAKSKTVFHVLLSISSTGSRIFPVTVTHNYISGDVVGGRNRTTAYKANPRISTAAPHRTEEYLFICPCFLHIALLHWKKHFRRLSFGGERTGLHTKSSIMTNNLNGRTAFAPFLRVLWNVPGQCPLLRLPIKNGVATHMVNICVCLV